MEEEQLKKLNELVDRQAIYDCIQRNARGLDRLDAELLASTYHDDAYEDHSTYCGPASGVVNYWLPIIRKLAVCQHHLTNHTVEIDGNVAHAETCAIAAVRAVDSDKINIRGGRYIDRLEKRNGEWRIAARLQVTDWRGGFDAERMEPFRERDRTDPSYMRPLEITRAPFADTEYQPSAPQ